MKQVDDVNDTINKIITITSNYTNYNSKKFDYLNEEVNSWTTFLKNEVDYSSSNLRNYISDKILVNKCINTLKKYNKKILHANFVTHNFIKTKGKLIDAIDPMPVIGDYLYDLLFAIVSNVTILSNIILDKLYTLINEPQEKINSILAIVLYCRISKCLKYHPKDIDIYMNF